MASVPEISIIIPCYNEEMFIETAIRSLDDSYVREHGEFIVVDGISSDSTLGVVDKLFKEGLPIRTINNEKRLQSYGLILGISEALGEIIVRADAHSIYPPEYVKSVVELLKTKGVSNAGGCMLPVGKTDVQKGVALSMQHPVGVGDAKFHLGNYAGFVDTVYLGCFYKSLFEEIGTYDPAAYPNEDAELNLRILQQGGKIYLDSSIKVKYFPRSSFKALMNQYYKYGKGRAYTTIKHNRISSWRQLIPPLFLVFMVFSLLVSIFAVSMDYFNEDLISILKYSFPLYIGFYLLGIGTVAFKGKSEARVKFYSGISFILMHCCWGSGFIAGYLFKRKV